MISDEEQERLEKAFMKRMQDIGVKPNTKKYGELQAEFFVGVMLALNIAFAPWAFSIMRGDDICKKYRNENKPRRGTIKNQF